MPRKKAQQPASPTADTPRAQRPKKSPTAEHMHGVPFPVVAVGASAGGLDAFRTLLRALPADTGMTFVLLQHLDPSHPSMLSELLARETTMPVTQATDGQQVEPNKIYVIPPENDLSIFHGKLQLVPRQHEHGVHLPIDFFFRSLALDNEAASIAIVLSGTGSDGVRGLREIKAAGGMTFVQDPITAEYDGMPRSAIAADVVDVVASPTAIAEELARIAKHPVLKRIAQQAEPEPERDGRAEYTKLFLILRNATGVDFSHYKETTIRRRIERRILLHQLSGIEDYTELLREEPGEVQALFRDLLINVTQFFRDPEVFDTLRNRVLPEILRGKTGADSVRIWVPGCSTGEEVYSLLIAVLETLETFDDRPSVTVFGTDVSDDAIAKARAGIYPSSIRADVSPSRISRYFTPKEDGYQVNKSIREMCVFARQDITRDPPFSRMDLVSMRNVLIYMDNDLQKRVMAILHYSLVADGFLLLGTSETVGAESQLFAPVDKQRKIYRRKDVSSRLPVELPAVSRSPLPTDGPVASAGKAEQRISIPSRRFSVQRQAEEIVLSQYAPPRVIVDTNGTILHFFGDTGPYLEHASGRASLNIMDMATNGLAMDIRETIEALRAGDDPIATRETFVKFPDGFRKVAVDAVGIDSPTGEDYTLIAFREVPQTVEDDDDGETPDERRDRREEQLRRELAAVRKHMQTVVEEKDDANEELRAANEEIQSSNEELQSINEELETAKEELQSTNEELTTINDELARRNAELAELNDDLNNFLISVDIPLMFLGRDLDLRRYTPQMQRIAEIGPADVGRPVSHLRLHVDTPELEEVAAEVIRTLRVREFDVSDSEGTWYAMQVRPYTTGENQIAGVVVRFIDVDQMKRTLADSERRGALNAALNEIDWAASSSLDVDEIMERVVGEAAAAVGCETAAIAMRAEGGWRMQHIFGMPEDLQGVTLLDEDYPHAMVAMTTGRPVAVEDAFNDRRVSRSIVRKYNIRSTLVVPLAVRDRILGMLFFNWHSANVGFTDIEIDFATRLGTTVSLALENARLYGRERRIAETLQEAVLAIPENVPGVDYGYLYCAASEAANVGGDFYDIFAIDDIHVGIVVGDVSGKGLEAARLTSLARDSVRAYAYEGASPVRVMARVNNAIRRSSPAENFVTLFFGVLDTDTGELAYCAGGHPGPIIRRLNGEVEMFKTNAPIVGAYTGFVCTETRAKLDRGDIVVLVTDGILEAHPGDSRDQFGDTRLASVIAGSSPDVRTLPAEVLEIVLKHAREELLDDAVILSVTLGDGHGTRITCPDRPEFDRQRSGGFAWPGIGHGTPTMVEPRPDEQDDAADTPDGSDEAEATDPQTTPEPASGAAEAETATGDEATDDADPSSDAEATDDAKDEASGD